MKYTKTEANQALNNLKKEYIYESGEVDYYKKEIDEISKVYEEVKIVKKDELSTGVFAGVFWGVNMLWGLFSVIPLVIFGFLTGRSVYNTISRQRRLGKAVKDCERYLNLIQQRHAVFAKNVDALRHDIDMLQDVVFSHKDITKEHEDIIRDWVDNIVGEFETEKEKTAYLVVRNYVNSTKDQDDGRDM